jgi:hypothetical protein
MKLRACFGLLFTSAFQDFVIPDHAAVARQDIRGKVRVDLIRIGVLGRAVPAVCRIFSLR